MTDALGRVPTPEIEKAMGELTPMARLGQAEDVSACALFLWSPAASYGTSEIYGVNGGLIDLDMKMPRAFE